MSLQQVTGVVEFRHATTGQRLISREALRDLPGLYPRGITEGATDQELLACYSDAIDRMAARYPDVKILTTAHL
jgi:hypothetical protein